MFKVTTLRGKAQQSGVKMKVRKKATHMYYLLDDTHKYVHILSSQAWITPVMLSERRSTRKCCQGFHPPCWLPFLPACCLSSSVRAFSSSCALFITPLSARITVGLEVRVTSRNTDVVIDFSWHWMGWGKNIFTLFSCLLSFCAPTKMTHTVGLWAGPAAFVTVWDVQIGACTPLFSKGGALV